MSTITMSYAPAMQVRDIQKRVFASLQFNKPGIQLGICWKCRVYIHIIA